MDSWSCFVVSVRRSGHADGRSRPGQSCREPLPTRNLTLPQSVVPLCRWSLGGIQGSWIGSKRPRTEAAEPESPAGCDPLHWGHGAVCRGHGHPERVHSGNRKAPIVGALLLDSEAALETSDGHKADGTPKSLTRHLKSMSEPEALSDSGVSRSGLRACLGRRVTALACWSRPLGGAGSLATARAGSR